MPKTPPKTVRPSEPRTVHGPQDVEDTRDHKTEKKLDRTVEDSFPASDPPSASPGAD